MGRGCKKFWVYKFRGAKILDLFINLGFQRLSHSQHFGVGVKIYQIVLKRSVVISADTSFVIFSSSGGNLIIVSVNVKNFGS